MEYAKEQIIDWRQEYDILLRERDEIRQVSHDRKEKVRVLTEALQKIDSLMQLSLKTEAFEIRGIIKKALKE